MPPAAQKLGFNYLWPHQCTILCPGVLPTKSSHRPLVDPGWPLHGLRPQECVAFWSLRFFPQIWWPYMAFLKQFNLQSKWTLTFGWFTSVVHLKKLTINIRGPFLVSRLSIPYQPKKFQLYASKHCETHSLHWLTDWLTKLIYIYWAAMDIKSSIPMGIVSFIRNLTSGWSQMTLAVSLTPTMFYTQFRGSSYQIWWPLGISKAIWPLDVTSKS